MKIAVDGYEVIRPMTGVGRVTDNLLQELVVLQPDWKFEVLTRVFAGQFESANVTQHVLQPDKGYFRWQNGPLRQKLNELKPDILMAPNYTLPVFYPGRSILFVHDVSFVSHPEWYSRKEAVLRKIMVRRSLKRASVVVTDSDFSRQEILRHFRIPESKIKVIYPGCNRSFNRVSKDEIATWKTGRDLTGKRIIGFLGSIFNRRNIPALTAAVELLHQEMPDVVLFIVGKDLTCPPQNMALLLDKNWIRWEKDISDAELPAFLSSLDVLAYLSDYEGFGLPPLEALSCGTVSLLLNRTSLKEVYQDIAVLVDSIAPDVVKAALTEILGDDKIKTRILQRFTAIQNRFSWQQAAKELSDNIRSL